MTSYKLILNLFLLTHFLAACTSPPTSMPTPTQSSSTSANPDTVISRITVTRPTTTPIPTNTNLPALTPTVTRRPTNAPRTSTATPTLTPTPDPNISLVADSEGQIRNVTISSQGHLAYIVDDILFVESEPGSHSFEEFGSGAVMAAWSPDGRQLVYSLADLTTEPEQHEQYLWTAETNTHTSLSQLISNYPNPPYRVHQAFWTPDGKKILFMSFLDDRHEPIPTMAFSYVLAVADLNQRTFMDNQVIANLQQPVWLSNDRYILRYHCGSPCAGYSSYDYSGQLIWRPYWDTGGMVAFAQESNIMINAGRIDTTAWDDIPAEPYPATIDEIDLTTGEVNVIWQFSGPKEEYFTPFFMPHISPDEAYITFNFGGLLEPGTVYIIDRQGNEYGQYPNTFVQDWRINNDLAITEILETGENRLLYVSLDGTTETIFITSQDTEIKGDLRSSFSGGKWSPDGRSFIFATRNNESEIEQLYLWQPEASSLTPIYTTDYNHTIRRFLWTADSQTLYLTTEGSNSEHDQLWRYDMPTP